MEATLATKTSGRDLGMGPKETCLQQQFVGNNPPSGCWMSNPNPPAEPQTISISSCSAASYDHHLKRSEDSVISCETVNSSPMLFSHYPEPYQLQKSYPSGTPSEPSFSISLEPNHGLTEAFLPSNTHTQLLEQISNLTGQPFGAYAEYMVSDHDVQGSVDHIYSSQAAGLPLSEQSLISNWQNNKLGTGFTTLAWKSPHVSHSETNLPNICMASDEYTDQGFHLSVPRSSCNKRSNTSDSDEEMYHLDKKPTPWAFISTSADSKSSKLKPKAKKAGATDPQSVAARHRRERISERLKILQELIPNGSKVDLVTMLEKAISYVKFLQLQVKVLTTDEYWPTQDGSLPNIDKVKEALQVLTSTRSSVDTDGTSSSSSDLQKKQKSTTNTNNTKNDQNQKHASQ